MRQKGFRQNFTQSFATLPLVALVTAAVWMLPNLSSLRLGGGLLATALMTYVVIECNNRYHLHLIPAAALLSAYFVLFRTYGQTRTQGTLFHTTLLLSLGSLAFPQLIVVLPFLLFVAAVQLRALNLNAFGGALLGALLPYWIYLAVQLALCDFDWTLVPAQLWEQLPPLPTFAYADVPLPHWVGYAAVIVPGMVATAHFFSSSYNDKIRTRQFLYALTVLQIPILLLTALYPGQRNTLLPLLIVVYTPMISHHLTLARGRMADVWFILCTLGVLVLTALQFFSF